MCAIFEFEPRSDRIVCERVYFDQATIAQQLLGDGGATTGASGGSPQ
jgi:hypothetical protein